MEGNELAIESVTVSTQVSIQSNGLFSNMFTAQVFIRKGSLYVRKYDTFFPNSNIDFRIYVL